MSVFVSDSDFTWILHPEVAEENPSGMGTTTWGISVDGSGRFHIHRAEFDWEPVVTTYTTWPEALAALPRPMATYLESHGQSMVLWSLEIAEGRARRRGRDSNQAGIQVAQR